MYFSYSAATVFSFNEFGRILQPSNTNQRSLLDMNDSCSNVRCPHSKPVQMLRHPCFTMEQFIEAIHLVQSGHVPPSSPKPFGWPYRPEDEVCPVHTQIGSHSPEDRSPVTEEDNSSDISIDDIWIGPEAAAADNSFNNSSSDNGGDDAESSVVAADNSLDNSPSDYGGDEAESSASGTETLINLDPAHFFNWFVVTSHFGVGIFSEIYTARKLRAPGTSVHYFTTLHEAKQHFNLALAMWCGETV